MTSTINFDQFLDIWKFQKAQPTAEHSTQESGKPYKGFGHYNFGQDLEK